MPGTLYTFTCIAQLGETILRSQQYAPLQRNVLLSKQRCHSVFARTLFLVQN